MSILSFTEASKKLGFKSRSSLYSLKKRGLLDQNISEIRGIDHLCWKPVGKSRLPEYLSSLVQLKVNGLITTRFLKVLTSPNFN